MFGLHHISFGPRDVVAKTVSGTLWGVTALVFGSVLVPMTSHLGFQFLVARRLTRQVAR